MDVASGSQPVMSVPSSSGSSSATEVSSHSRKVNINSSIPTQPIPNDPEEWAKFLRSYQTGNWHARRASEPGSPQSQSTCSRRGSSKDNLDFFNENHYLSAPAASRELNKKRSDTVARYGFSDLTTRSSVVRYVKHAKNVFRCDFASVSVPCAEGRKAVVLGWEGAPTSMCSSATNTICDHALLLKTDEIFVVADLLLDWRFKHFIFRDKEGSQMRFYASAPISLLPMDGESKGKVHIGRLTIMRKDAWPEFGNAEAEILMDIARMAEEALENEYHQRSAKKSQQIQREVAHLSWQLNVATDEDMVKDKTTDAKLGILLCPTTMRRVIDVVKNCVGADAVTALDVTEFHLQQQTQHQASIGSLTSPRSSISAQGMYPSMPWLNTSTMRHSLYPKRSSEIGSQVSLRTPTESVGSSDGDTQITSPSDQDQTDQQQERPPLHSEKTLRPLQMLHSRTSSSNAPWAGASDTYDAAPGQSARVIASIGNKDVMPDATTSTHSEGICSFLSKVRQKKKFNEAHTFERKQTDQADSDEEEEKETEDKRPLDCLMTPETQSYCAIPVFANDRVQPWFLFLVTFNHRKLLLETEKLFLYSIAIIVGSTCLRQQARLADRAQLDFIRSVQHELRTPLNGILGITDFLRQNFISDDAAERLDLSEDGVLASLLEAIRLSGVNLSDILDDVLDFGAVSGLRVGTAQTTKIDEIDLVREVEDACLDELEHIAMHERQDKKMRVYRGYYAVPTLVIKIGTELHTKFRTDKAKLRKILCKFVANALQYSDEHELVEVTVRFSPSHGTAGSSTISAARRPSSTSERWIEFIIRDTGVGMTQDFLNNSLLKPFSKADSFSQGVGLGVTIAASLISQMGGQLNIVSEVGKGTKVHFVLPLTQRSLQNPKTSSVEMLRPFQIKTACFFGHVLEGQKKIFELIQERLVQHGVRIVEAGKEPADLLVVKESALVKMSEQAKDTEAAKIAMSIPRPTGPKARVMVVTRNALRGKGSAVLEGLPIWAFRPPFGPTTLDAMEDFLREESPIVLSTVPNLTPAAEYNMKQILKQQGSTPAEAPPTGMYYNATPAVSGSIPENIEGEKAAQEEDGKVQADLSARNRLPAPLADQQTDLAGNPFRVLVVEDNYVNMRLITAVLTRGGYSFVEAKDGVEAVEQYRSFSPSVVLLDISLPLQDGFAACVQMRAHQMQHTPRIIAVTALSSTADKLKGLEECGMDDWRTKPLSIKALRTDLVAWKREWEALWPASPAAETPSAPLSQGIAT